MKIRFLGTAAAEGYPALFCQCDNCKKAWAAGGRNIRSRSQALVDDALLIDFPCDSFYHAVQNGVDLTAIGHCLITHTHSDHLYAEDLSCLLPGYSHPGEAWQGISLYGSKDLAPLARLEKLLKGNFRLNLVEPFVPFQAGDWTVTALKAHHGTAHPYIYIVSDGKKSMLYAHDTGLFPEKTLDYLRETKPHLDLVSLDCTEGSREEVSYGAHMGLGWNRQSRAQLREMGCADDKTVFVLNHFSHNGPDSLYDEFSVIAGKEGFVTSYDGLEIEF